MTDHKPPPKLDPRKLTLEQGNELIRKGLLPGEMLKLHQEQKDEELEAGRRAGWKPLK